MAEDRFAFGRFVLDAGRGLLLADGHPLTLGSRALGVLHALVRANGQVVTKAVLMEFAWPGAVVEESNLSVQIAALRKALGRKPDGGEWVATVARIGYRFAGDVTPLTDEGDAPELGSGTSPPRKPSVVVLPFANLSGDAEQEYFADGITEDIIAALSRFRWFFVIARSSSFAFKHKAIGAKEIAQILGVRYVLAGSVRKSDRRIRISAQLVDARGDTELWADRYDFEMGELFSVQDEIAERVVGAIEPELLKTESAFAVGTRRAARDMTGWDLVHQGTWYFHKMSRPTHVRARELFRQACAVDPQLAEAHAWLGRVSTGLVAYAWSDNEADDLREGMAAALRAVQMDQANPYCHYALAINSAFAGEFDQAIRAAERAVELSPGFALGHLVLGITRLFTGNAAQAQVALERGLRLNPHDPQNFVWHNTLATAQFMQDDYESALRSATNALKVRPWWGPAMETTVCCLCAMGRLQSAREQAQQLARCEAAPNALAPLRRANPAWSERVKALLSEAGWPAS